jgi:hypothetical protein
VFCEIGRAKIEVTNLPFWPPLGKGCEQQEMPTGRFSGGKMKKLTLGFFALATALAITPAALATTLTFNYSFSAGAGELTGSGQIAVDSVTGTIIGVNGSVADTLLGISGGVSGTPFTIGSVTFFDPLAPGTAAYVAGGVHANDNLLTLPGGTLDVDGFAFDYDGGLGQLQLTSIAVIATSTENPANADQRSIPPGTEHVTNTPEPSSLILLGSGLLGLAFLAFRKAKPAGLLLNS